MSKSSEKALSLLRHMPRLTLRAAERMPDTRKKVNYSTVRFSLFAVHHFVIKL